MKVMKHKSLQKQKIKTLKSDSKQDVFGSFLSEIKYHLHGNRCSAVGQVLMEFTTVFSSSFQNGLTGSQYCFDTNFLRRQVSEG